MRLRRLLLAAVGVLTVAASAGAAPAAAAPTLSLARATAVAEGYADALAISTFAQLQNGGGVTGCRRVNARVVDCAIFTLGQSLPPEPRNMRCDDAVRVYIAPDQLYQVLTKPIGLPRCAPV